MVAELFCAPDIGFAYDSNSRVNHYSSCRFRACLGTRQCPCTVHWHPTLAWEALCKPAQGVATKHIQTLGCEAIGLWAYEHMWAFEHEYSSSPASGAIGTHAVDEIGRDRDTIVYLSSQRCHDIIHPHAPCSLHIRQLSCTDASGCVSIRSFASNVLIHVILLLSLIYHGDRTSFLHP